jgi:glycosyltransferase involved in cell wall biosynthesis
MGLEVMEVLFWVGFAGVLYAYLGYPALLAVWSRARGGSGAPEPARDLPPISVVLPVHNEEDQLPGRLDNLLSAEYPASKLEVLVVSDGSTDRTTSIARTYAEAHPGVRLLELSERQGKGNALNAGVASASHDLVIFTDAGIRLEPGAVRALVLRFQDPRVGCASGEDRVPGGGGEGLYGRYELWLRRLESGIHSIVGASGSIYAQRRALCPNFEQGLAPDFLSVLHTVERGYRAISVPEARGVMGAVPEPSREFQRKVRTLIRGMTVLRAHLHLLNPVRFGVFSFILFSHKVIRWSVPMFLVMMIVGNVALLGRPGYAALAVPHGLFYLLALVHLAAVPALGSAGPARVAGYFVNVNAAIAVAWWQFLRGKRQEIWSPSRRSSQEDATV